MHNFNLMLMQVLNFIKMLSFPAKLSREVLVSQSNPVSSASLSVLHFVGEKWWKSREIFLLRYLNCISFVGSRDFTNKHCKNKCRADSRLQFLTLTSSWQAESPPVIGIFLRSALRRSVEALSVDICVGEPSRSAEVQELFSWLNRPVFLFRSCGENTSSFLQHLRFLRLPIVVFNVPGCNYSMASDTEVLKLIFVVFLAEEAPKRLGGKNTTIWFIIWDKPYKKSGLGLWSSAFPKSAGKSKCLTWEMRWNISSVPLACQLWLWIPTSLTTRNAKKSKYGCRIARTACLHRFA